MRRVLNYGLGQYRVGQIPRNDKKGNTATWKRGEIFKKRERGREKAK